MMTSDHRSSLVACAAARSLVLLRTGILELKQVHLSRTATGTCTVAREVLVLVYWYWNLQYWYL